MLECTNFRNRGKSSVSSALSESDFPQDWYSLCLILSSTGKDSFWKVLWYLWSFIPKLCSGIGWFPALCDLVILGVCLESQSFSQCPVYQEWEWLQTSGNRHYQQRSKRGKMLFILLQAKKACQGRSWGIHKWIYTLGTLCTVLRPVQELTCIRHKTKCMEPHLGFCD